MKLHLQNEVLCVLCKVHIVCSHYLLGISKYTVALGLQRRHENPSEGRVNLGDSNVSCRTLCRQKQAACEIDAAIIS